MIPRPAPISPRLAGSGVPAASTGPKSNGNVRFMLLPLLTTTSRKTDSKTCPEIGVFKREIDPDPLADPELAPPKLPLNPTDP